MKWRAPCQDPLSPGQSHPPALPVLFKRDLPGAELCCFSWFCLRQPTGLGLRSVQGLEGPLLRAQRAHSWINRATLQGTWGPLGRAIESVQMGLRLKLMLGGNARAFELTPPVVWFIINSENTERGLFLLSTHVFKSTKYLSHLVLGFEKWAKQTPRSQFVLIPWSKTRQQI